ncbi:MAG: DUF1846 domain-containing protein [Muribaculaceae bacterium]|nr:DUF1846 domain-containing protein [Muribaculaceae bacterium]
MKKGFDNDKYLKIQSEHIKERIAKFGNKLYLELGGKLFDDYHASRVLPGFQPDSKLRMLSQLSDHAEIVIVISARDIEKNKVRQDLGITYDMDVLRLREAFMGRGFLVSSVVITHYNGQSSADAFRSRLERLGITTYYHYTIDGYPTNVALIDSDEGFGKNDYIRTTRPLVIVTAPGPGSGKMAVCLSQLYNEHKRGVEAGYAKFETFPVWSLPLKHPVNIAYEAATADLNDVNMIDPFHLEAYGKTAINYNRDIEIFPVLNALFEGIYGENPYKSPTDMGVNMVGFCISDDEVCCDASRNEIILRYFTALNRFANGESNDSEVNKTALLLKQAKIDLSYRKPIGAARKRAEESDLPCAAIELPDGTIITSSTSDLLGPSAALILNAVKYLAGIDHDVKLIPQHMIEPIQHTKTQLLRSNNPRLHTDEVLVALSVLSTHDENCRRALEKLSELRGCQAHFTVMLGEVDNKIFKKLGVGLTCDPAKKR